MRRLLWTIAICLSLAAPLSAATVDGLAIHSSTTRNRPGHSHLHSWLDVRLIVVDLASAGVRQEVPRGDG